MNLEYVPDISVVIPTYNRANTIERAINSVLHQTYQDLEIIVVDDGSRDNTSEIVGEMERKDKRIRYVYQENQGAQVARNRGILESRYDWIAFLDSDDEWLSNKLEFQAKVLQSENFSPFLVVHCDCIVKDVLHNYEYRRNLPKISGEDVYERLLASGGPMFQGMVTSKQALERIGLLDTKVVACQEWDASIELAKYCKFIFVDEPLFTYYLHEGETISKDHLREIEGMNYIIRKRKQDILSRCGNKVWNQLLHLLCEKCISFRFYERACAYYSEIYGRNLKFDDFVDAIQKQFHKVQGIYCYGAGDVGRIAKSFFDYIGIKVKGFVVSPGQPTGMFEGLCVSSIADIDGDENSCIVISAREKNHVAIKKILKQYNYHNIYPISDETCLLMHAAVIFKKE